jgi:hypothetical protein
MVPGRLATICFARNVFPVPAGPHKKLHGSSKTGGISISATLAFDITAFFIEEIEAARAGHHLGVKGIEADGVGGFDALHA